MLWAQERPRSHRPRCWKVERSIRISLAVSSAVKMPCSLLRKRLFATSRLPRSRRRSEEHTSELQSLMRISYAVFCLKKHTNHKIAEATDRNQQHDYHI